MSYYLSHEDNSQSKDFYGEESKEKFFDNCEPILPINERNIDKQSSIIENAKKEINDAPIDNFLKNIKEIFQYFYFRLTYILNLNKEIKYPTLNINNLKSNIKFLEDIDKIYNDNAKSIAISPQYGVQILKDIIMDVMFNNPNELEKEEEIRDAFERNFSLEKYDPNEKGNQRKPAYSTKILILPSFRKIERKFLELISIKNYLKMKYINDLDSRGDFILPNTRNILKRGNEDYNPPYGWIGIGLNVSNNYKGNEEDSYAKWLKESINSKWAIAYLGFNHEINGNDANDENIISNNNLKYLHDLIKDNEKLKILERKVDFNDDKRHWRKKYNEGIYLHSKIENAEKDAGLINIKDKKYKVLLMARVKIDEISQPKNENFWVLGKKFIRIYRILFKEIKNI